MLWRSLTTALFNRGRPFLPVHSSLLRFGSFQLFFVLHKTRPTVFMSILSHLSLTMVPLMIGAMFSQTEILKEAWLKNVKIFSNVPVESLASQYSVSEDS
jgi:hypothetical protein